ncbi:endolytic transglycosylase MltG [Marivivens aquimaris]|uniref:endolytic transglycosylase MltG n=1 Tax=Marivivens aquimaris TaxID=2774876 RepID=UPI00188158B4|nr:endolytic transglycosylase MltG [Marivivens aquimaris]
MWRNLASNALTLFIVVLFLLGGVVLWGQRAYQEPGPLAQAMCLEVPPNSGIRRVAAELENMDAITSRMIFNIATDMGDKNADLKAGSFLIPAGASMEQIITEITGTGQSTCGTQVVYVIGVNRAFVRVNELDPETREFDAVAEFDIGAADVPAEYTAVREQADTRYAVNVVEGGTSYNIVQALNGIDALEGEITEIPAEGSLAPQYYEFQPGDSVTALVQQMEDKQVANLAAAWEQRADDLPYDTPEEALIMASIVEKETGIASERPQVASVFINRLRQGMRLQTDPTVIYGVTNGEGVLGRGLRRSELDRQTPYNTYLIDGLPPTPIANPGMDAIMAAVKPDETDYIFFVAKTLNPADGHVFSTNLSDHNDNVAAFRALEAAAN